MSNSGTDTEDNGNNKTEDTLEEGDIEDEQQESEVKFMQHVCTMKHAGIQSGPYCMLATWYRETHIMENKHSSVIQSILQPNQYFNSPSILSHSI